MRTVPERVSPGFERTFIVTLPSLETVEGLSIQSSVSVTTHWVEQAVGPAVTVEDPSPAPKCTDDGDTLSGESPHWRPLWATVNVSPAARIVPSRSVVFGFASTV